MAFLSFVCLIAVFSCICSGAVLEHKEDPKECVTTLSDIHAKEDFVIKNFLGVWWTHYMTEYVFGDKTWDSLTNTFYLNGEELTQVTSGHQKGSDKCDTVVLPHLHEEHHDEGGVDVEEVGVYTGQFKGKKYLFKVLYTNDKYTTATIFLCFDTNEDGGCKKGSEQIELWSRTPEDMSETEVKDLKDHVEKIHCIDVNDLHVKKQDKCGAPSSADEPNKAPEKCRWNPPDNDTQLIPANRPVGTYQSIFEAVPDGIKAAATSYKFIPGAADDALYVLRSHESGEICSVSTVDKFQRLSKNHYLQMFASKPEEIWIFVRPDGKLGIYTCIERNRGHCKEGKSHIELLVHADNHSPISYKDFKGFVDIVNSMQCTQYKFFADQKAGVCAPSDIQGTIVSINDRIHHSKIFIPPKSSLVPKTTCKLADIPLQDAFKIEQLAGTWYEIAKPISSRKGFESGAEHYHIEDDHTVHMSYSGAVDHKCAPSIDGHVRQVPGSSKGGDLQTTLDGPTDIFDWVPLKIVYNDGMYSLNYECYRQGPPGTCVRGKATILGRRPTIDEDTKHKLYDMLPSLCLSGDQMFEPAHNTDCSEWTHPHEDDTEPHQCHVYDIHVQKKVSMELMVGTWYVAASKNFDSSLIEIKRQGTTFVAEEFAKRDGHCSKVLSEAITQYDDAEHNGDFLVSSVDGHVSPYFSCKIIYTDYKVAVIYICKEEDHDGICTPAGTRTFVMSRQEVISTLQLSTLLTQLHLSCGDLSDIHPVPDHCHPSEHCLVSDIHVMEHLNKQKLTGDWYDVNIHREADDVTSGKFVLTLDEHGHFHITFTGLGDETCNAELRQRHNKVDGDFLATELASSEKWGFVSLKVLYTDYESVMVVYVCTHVDLNGECADKRGRIYSRTAAEMTTEKLMHYFDEACVHSEDVKETHCVP